ncbi:G-protein coupled receptor activity protein [Homalodisca vitripennis]|nr:G-protein coupled receptor activity protein [Homalodisca vitripennis]
MGSYRTHLHPNHAARCHIVISADSIDTTSRFDPVCSFLSVWFVVAFTVERFIAVRYPLKRPSMCTVTRAKMVLSVLTLFTLSMCSPYLFISAPQWRPDPDR